MKHGILNTASNKWQNSHSFMSRQIYHITSCVICTGLSFCRWTITGNGQTTLTALMIVICAQREKLDKCSSEFGTGSTGKYSYYW